jgi:biopolymer transport protein ExbB
MMNGSNLLITLRYFSTDILDYLSGGGMVMIPLAFISLWMWVLIIERLIYFYSLRRKDADFTEIIEIWKGKHVPSCRQGLRADIARSFTSLRTGNPIRDKQTLRLLVMRIRPSLRCNIMTIGVLAGIAPLLGLLGTVTGMMTTFDVLATYGTGNVRAMAGGLSEALLTTQTGLIVAIPGMFMMGFLERRAGQMERLLDSLTLSFKHHIGRNKKRGIV